MGLEANRIPGVDQAQHSLKLWTKNTGTVLSHAIVASSQPLFDARRAIIGRPSTLGQNFFAAYLLGIRRCKDRAKVKSLGVAFGSRNSTL
jgi:hypothetical protein